MSLRQGLATFRSSNLFKNEEFRLIDYLLVRMENMQHARDTSVSRYLKRLINDTSPPETLRTSLRIINYVSKPQFFCGEGVPGYRG